ncbi:thioether cross-link-forming SCIFF peptide maturase [Hungatella hathewayi]|uniref:thioether cross-link-forming SCIFF peptide maturase n=1 Tax=Hungatella hathewayi TaxID=154046 RepID=UPI0011DCE395|nr:thioether cross-link-forming SCIFF peptide maturase [Hungatella hathewayi]
MIHQYINNGFHIIMDVNSGSVHSVDPVMYDAVEIVAERVPELAEPQPLPAEVAEEVKERLSPTYGEAEVLEALEEIQYLIDAEELLTTDQYHDYVVDFKKRKTVVKALCLHIAHDCNLACQYCFAEEGEYHGRRALMSFEVGKKALDFLIANSGNRRNLEVDFFGGEPLMNWEVVKQLVEYGRSKEKEYNKNFRFTMTTNGVLLNDEIMEYCNREMSNVVLSLDGRKEVNDKMRPFRGGKGSYDLIVPKFQKFAEMRGDRDYYVRGTFTRHNLDFSKDVMEFADLGFRSMSIEPVVVAPEEEYAIREEDLPQIMEEYDRLAEEYLKRKKEGRGFNFFHFNIDLNQGPCVAKRLSGCGSGTEYLAVTPWGDLYPCHQFVGQEEFLLGNVDTGVTNERIRDEFKLCNVYAKDKCRDCFARFYCSGGCAANSYNFHGSITDAYDIGCAMQKKRIECAIMLKAALAED